MSLLLLDICWKLVKLSCFGQKADALKYFTEIKDNYDNTPEAQSVDGLIGLAQ
jgi:hypothetical protein